MSVDTIFRRVIAENPGVVDYHRPTRLLVADIIDVLEDKEASIDDQVVEDDDEPSLYRARVFIGGYAATPSGKVYAPFAASNLDPCPECGGTGVVAPRTARELFLCREMTIVNEARPETPDGFDFQSPEWRAWAERYNALVLQGVQSNGSMNLDCTLCEDGYHEPALDAAWREECKAQAAALGDGFYFDEVDGDYYLVLSFVHDDGEGEE